MIVSYEIDKAAMQGVKPFTKVRGRTITRTGKRKEIVQYIPLLADEAEINSTKTSIKGQLACIK